MIRLLNWLRGWRLDVDGWWVRARREHDPDVLPPEVGFVEEACVAVRTPAQAYAMDSRWPLPDEAVAEAAARGAGWTFDEEANEYRLNDTGNGYDKAIYANVTWRELCWHFDIEVRK